MVIRVILIALCFSSGVASAQSSQALKESTDQTASASEVEISSPPEVAETPKTEAPPPQPPDLTKWHQKWRAANKSFEENMNSKLIIIKLSGKIFSAIDTDTISKKDSHHLFTPSDQERDLQLDINQTKNGNPCVRKRPALLKCLSAGYILDISKNKWEFLSVGQTEDKLLRIFTAKKDPSNDYYRWLNENLGFNARVLDAQDGYILALTPPLAKFKSVTGQILLDSSDKAFLRTSDIKPGPNLELVSAKGRLAVLRITSASPDTAALTLKLSTKIRLSLPTDGNSAPESKPTSKNDANSPEQE
jgi:hypothetical protein